MMAALTPSNYYKNLRLNSSISLNQLIEIAVVCVNLFKTKIKLNYNIF
jgi:hypothetical protein